MGQSLGEIHWTHYLCGLGLGSRNICVRSILGFWDVEDIWEMPYRTYTYIISLITIVATIAVLIKIKRAEDAAEEKSED